jgi:preprotein translocase subunit SecE
MTKQKQKVQKVGQDGASVGFWSELFRLGLYKPNQGRIVRQVTFLACAIIVCLAVYEMYRTGWLTNLFAGSQYFVFIALTALGIWFSYRVVNYSVFADFLIAVEAEMNKVSWPSKTELWNASLVVMFVIFAMAALLFAFDVIWSKIFQLLRIRY